MTGVELILAVIPLVISVVEHHKTIKKGGKALLSNKAKQEQQRDFYLELYDELALFRSTLGLALSGLPLRGDSPEISELTEEERQEIDKVLGANADPFHSNLERLLKGLEDLVSDRSLSLLSRDPNMPSAGTSFRKLELFKQQIDKGETLRSLRTRLIFTMNDKSRRHALLKIQQANLKLERLFRGSSLSGNSGFRQPATRKPMSARLRRLSEPLFKKIAGKWPKACECHNQHEARLCLWNCCSNHRHSELNDSLVMIMSVTDVKDDGAPWSETSIKMSAESTTPPPKPTVRFRVNGETIETPPSNTKPPGWRDIDSENHWCSMIRQANGRKSSLQIIFDEAQGKLWQVQSRRLSLGLQKQKDITLGELLCKPCKNIKLKEQRILAVVLAHAALHCSNSPWLCEDWSKDHISFFRSESTLEPDLSRPYLKVRFNDNADDFSDTDDPLDLPSTPALLSLGFLLLEIYLKNTIESQWSPEDLIDGQPNENTNLTTALRLLDDSEDDLYEGYRTAIKACFDCDSLGLNAEQLAKKVYNEIVYPLECELEHGWHIKPEDLQLASAVHA